MSFSLFEIEQININFIKKLGLVKNDTNLNKLFKLFYENLSIDLKHEIVSSVGHQENNDRIYEFLLKEAFKKHYMEIIYQFFALRFNTSKRYPTKCFKFVAIA